MRHRVSQSCMTIQVNSNTNGCKNGCKAVINKKEGARHTV